MLPIVPTTRLVTLAFVATLVAVIAGFVAALRVPLGVLDFVIVAAALGDALALRRTTRIGVSGTAAPIFSIGRANVVTLLVEHRSNRALTRQRHRRRRRRSRTRRPRSKGCPAEVDLAPHQPVARQIRDHAHPARTPRARRGHRAVPGAPRALRSGRSASSCPHDVDVYPDIHAARLARAVATAGSPGRAHGLAAGARRRHRLRAPPPLRAGRRAALRRLARDRPPRRPHGPAVPGRVGPERGLRARHRPQHARTSPRGSRASTTP